MQEEDNDMKIQRVEKGLSYKLKLFGITKLEHIQNLPEKDISKLAASVISRKSLVITILKATNGIPRAYTITH